jgi:hypothetical protein
MPILEVCLHLLGYERDAELGEPLAHPMRIGTPLRLIQLDHPLRLPAVATLES